MRIMTWNVNGIRAVHKKGFFMPFMEHYKPDILCLQETKAEKHQSPVVVAGYEEYWNSAHRKGYAGTAIFTRNMPKSVQLGLPDAVEEKFHMKTNPYGDPNNEGRVILADYGTFAVINVYTPNSKPDLSRLDLRHELWDPAFLAFCKQVSREKEVIICGDLNVAHTHDDIAGHPKDEQICGFTREERHGMDMFLKAGFVDSFRMLHKGNGHYTWWSHFAAARERNIGWRIDYILVSQGLKDKVKKCTIESDVFGSDHCPVLLDIDL